MAITILARHPEAYTKTVLPRAHGYEERDTERYPLPPDVNMSLVASVVDELRDLGHIIAVKWQHEQLADWDTTHRKNQRSFCSDEEWQPNPKGPVLIHFIGGGWACDVLIDDRTVRLLPPHFRMGRKGMVFALLGRL